MPTNLTLQSEDLSTSWTTFNSTVSTDTVAAPDGNTTADTINEDNSAGALHSVSQTDTTLADSTVYVMSAFAKEANRNWFLINWRSKSGSHERCYFDLNAGSVGTSTADAEGMIDFGDGWYRCWIACGSDTGATQPQVSYAPAEADLDRFFDGLTQASTYMWGAQLEARSATAGPSHYIPTTTAAVTRSYTRLGLSAIPRQRYGYFWGKAAAAPAAGRQPLLTLLGVS